MMTKYKLNFHLKDQYFNFQLQILLLIIINQIIDLYQMFDFQMLHSNYL